MESETHRVFLLELQMQDLQRRQEREIQDLRDLRSVMEATARRVHTAESWGRGVIWTTIALGGFATQFTEIVTWLK